MAMDKLIHRGKIIISSASLITFVLLLLNLSGSLSFQYTSFVVKSINRNHAIKPQQLPRVGPTFFLSSSSSSSSSSFTTITTTKTINAKQSIFQNFPLDFRRAIKSSALFSNSKNEENISNDNDDEEKKIRAAYKLAIQEDEEWYNEFVTNILQEPKLKNGIPYGDYEDDIEKKNDTTEMNDCEETGAKKDDVGDEYVAQEISNGEKRERKTSTKGEIQKEISSDETINTMSNEKKGPAGISCLTKQSETLETNENEQERFIDSLIMTESQLIQLQSLGYSLDECKCLAMDVLDLILQDSIQRPKSGIPDRWNVDYDGFGEDDFVTSDNDDEEETMKEEHDLYNEGKASFRKLKNENDKDKWNNDEPSLSSTIPSRSSAQEQEKTKEQQRELTEEEQFRPQSRPQSMSSRELEARGQRSRPNARRPPPNPRSRQPSRQRTNSRQPPGSRSRPQRPPPRQRQRQRLYDEEDEYQNKFWPSKSTFESYLRREAQLRLAILGPSWKSLVKNESQWRLDLYKQWLRLLEDGIGDEIITNGGNASRSNGTSGRRRRRASVSSSPERRPQRRRRRQEFNDDDDDDEYAFVGERRRRPRTEGNTQRVRTDMDSRNDENAMDSDFIPRGRNRRRQGPNDNYERNTNMESDSRYSNDGEREMTRSRRRERKPIDDYYDDEDYDDY